MFGLSWAAQRGCWKLFHDTPTVQPAPPDPAAAADPPALAAGLPPPLLLQAAAMIAITANIGAIRRTNIRYSSSSWRFDPLSNPTQVPG
jgi:hypothetical protein